ncbi:LysE family transporter [Polymorphospora sp. NPDC050346]|uniref:LysE family transporter n=1 Tax=Polymorphospora sp. NPDC050346 TaxID=3155780 RepID=UPI0033F7FB07
MEISKAFLSGVLAGLAVAVPLGAIGVLLLKEGVQHGVRRAWTAAAGVAAADVVYCTVAVLFGAVTAPVVTRLAPWPAVVGGLALVGIAARGLVRGLSSTAAPAAPDRSPGPRRRFTAFLALTMINPATLVYFAAITTGLGTVSQTRATSTAFIVGVGLASVAWQILLVAVGSTLKTHAGQGAQRVTVLAGNAVVGVLGLLIVTGAVL